MDRSLKDQSASAPAQISRISCLVRWTVSTDVTAMPVNLNGRDQYTLSSLHRKTKVAQSLLMYLVCGNMLTILYGTYSIHCEKRMQMVYKKYNSPLTSNLGPLQHFLLHKR
ncbi:hypothetical protein SFRURICE_010252 [Spodoptera frugiperda]|nr:hypothetical protein SFRURICE_010252 [Spodoptera frugiperda]